MEGLRLTPGEVQRMIELLGRDPTRVEATIFDTMWSEHCSYKSSRWVLKAHLPTESPHVILGPAEDAGGLRLGSHDGIEYALVIGHESDHHPSQAVPTDGARTGTATDETGFGGASFASAVLEEDAEGQRGHVQVPDPFLKRVLFEANRAALEWLHAEKVAFGFKDLGAGGIACASSELAASGGFGMDVDLDLVPASRGDLPPEVLACSETQERFAMVVPERVAERVLSIYNTTFALPEVYHGARAAVVGRVRAEKQYRILHHGQPVCDSPVEVITAGIEHQRPQRARPAAPPPVALPPVEDHEEFFTRMAGSLKPAPPQPLLRDYDP